MPPTEPRLSLEEIEEALELCRKATPEPWVVVERETLEDSSVYPMHILGGSRQLTLAYLEPSSLTHNPYHDEMYEGPEDVRSRRANGQLACLAATLLPRALRELRECRLDGERLDWLGKNDWLKAMRWLTWKYTDYDDLRAAIDAARAKEAP